MTPRRQFSSTIEKWYFFVVIGLSDSFKAMWELLDMTETRLIIMIYADNKFILALNTCQNAIIRAVTELKMTKLLNRSK